VNPIPGVGIDLLDIGRLERALDRRPGLAARLFDHSEIEACAKTARPARHLAARFCAKEAVTKALGLQWATMTDIIVGGGGGQPPSLRLKGRAAKICEEAGVQLKLSLTHERNMAAAVVVASR